MSYGLDDVWLSVPLLQSTCIVDIWYCHFKIMLATLHLHINISTAKRFSVCIKANKSPNGANMWSFPEWQSVCTSSELRVCQRHKGTNLIIISSKLLIMCSVSGNGFVLGLTEYFYLVRPKPKISWNQNVLRELTWNGASHDYQTFRSSSMHN